MTRDEMILLIEADARYVMETCSQAESYGNFADRATEELASVAAIYAEMRRKTDVVRGLLFGR